VAEKKLSPSERSAFDGEIVKASSLSGASNLLFRRNSLDGRLEVIMRTGSWGGLNSVLHSN